MRRILGAVLAAGMLMGAEPVRAHDSHVHGAMSIGRPAKPEQATRTVQVVMSDEMRFTPAKIDVKRGETLRFIVRNTGQMKHEFMIGTAKELKEHAAVMQKHPEMKHDEPNAISVEPGQTGEIAWQFTQAGRFMFGCLVPGHYEAGMAGHLHVQENKGAATGAKPAK